MVCAKGGVFYFEGSILLIENAVFKNVESTGEGGVLYVGPVADSRYEIKNC